MVNMEVEEVAIPHFINAALQAKVLVIEHNDGLKCSVIIVVVVVYWFILIDKQ